MFNTLAGSFFTADPRKHEAHGGRAERRVPRAGGAAAALPRAGAVHVGMRGSVRYGPGPLAQGQGISRSVLRTYTSHRGCKKKQQKKPNGLLCLMEKPDNDKGQTGQTSAPHRRFAETFRSQPPSDKETLSLQWHRTPHRIKNKYARLPRNSAIPMVQVRGEKESLQSAAARGSIFQAAKTAGMSPPPPGSTIAR